MGWDVKATADRVFAAIDAVPTPSAAQVNDTAQAAQAAANQVGSAIAANPGSFISYTLASVVLMSIAGLLWRLRGRIYNALEETLFSNWLLALMAATAFVLSLASGYTTWDGMRNFTGEAVLSMMVTFGIQGVMLVSAWLIGESFAVGMNQRSSLAKRDPLLEPWVANVVGSVTGIALFIAVAVFFLQSSSVVDTRSAVVTGASWSKFSDKLLIIATGLLMVVLIAIYAASDLVRPYLQSGRVIIKNSVLWVMFLSCMATSVFFSFDSLFTAIFPQSERVRAAELRAQNQVAGIVADIETKITDGRLEEAQALFHTPGWLAYEKQTDQLLEQARSASATIDKYWSDQLEERNRAIKQQQERMSTAQGGQAGLAGRKLALGEELSRLKADRPQLAAEHAQKKADLDAKIKETDAKRVEAMAEAGGVEGTGKEGHGPIYRLRMDELAKLQAAIKIAEERSNDAKKRLAVTETRITQIEREQSTLDGDLAKLKGEAETAEQRIKLTQEQLPSEAGQRIDPSRIIPTFENARANFRQDPTVKGLAEVQQLCAQIYTAMATATPQTKKAVAAIDCDPKQAAEAASVVFALNAGTETFNQTCKGGDKLNQYTSADALFGFARKCLADSGLPSKETDSLRTKINGIELARDDKAHRFVVTWNAFQDGNRLAYLALAIAIAIDSLVFMSGLFGANAVRSPLSDVPSSKARSAQQLEATINAALGKLPYETAVLVLNAMRPITNTDGFSAVIDLRGADRLTADRIRGVLTAGADIHAVEAHATTPDYYRVRSELREYLSCVCERHFKADKSIAQQARLEQVVSIALKPHVHEHADLVINHLHPIKPTDGFTSEVSLAALTSRIEAYDARIIKRVINAGATTGAIVPDKSEKGRYYFRPDFVHALQTLLAHSDADPQGFQASRARFFAELDHRKSGGVIEGGVLQSDTPILAAQPQQRSLPNAEPAKKAEDLPLFLTANAAASSRDFITALISALGVRPEAYLNLPDSAFSAALIAADALADLRRDHRDLDEEFIARDEQASVRVERALEKLQRSLRPDDTHNGQLLKDAYQEVHQNWSILMLMPGGQYEQVLSELIEQLEPAEAEGALSPSHRGLLHSAKQLRAALVDNPRNSEAAWQHLGRALQIPPASHASLPQNGSDKPRFN